LSAFVRLWLGQPEVALDHDLRSLRLSPIDPRIGQVQTAIAFAHFNLEQFDEAAEWGEQGTRTQPNWPLSLGIAAASFALCGRQDEAQRAIARLRELNPIVSISTIVRTVPFRRHEDAARWAEGLRRAGLPE
jgi:adenylate cyclase